MTTSSKAVDVIVVGAGLAGLTAAVEASRAGAGVTLIERQAPGGRATSELRNGIWLNRGPHALYRGGPGWDVLRSLGLRPDGAPPPLRNAGVITGPIDSGELRDLPTTAGGILRAGWLAPHQRAQLGKALVHITTRSARQISRLQGLSAAEWIASLGLSEEPERLAGGLTTLATYCGDLANLSADAACEQLARSARRGVGYLHGGWRQLVEGIARLLPPAALTKATVEALVPDGPGVEVHLRGGERLRARAVVVAVESASAAARLLGEAAPAELRAAAGLTPATAACLSIVTRSSPDRTFVLAPAEPAYFSRHDPPSRLAERPGGCEVVEVARYGARAAALDRPVLERLAERAGLKVQDAEDLRFLADMIVISAPPNPGSGGLPGRPRAEGAAPEGCFLAGDYVGAVGLLADASLASGQEAGRAAAAFAAAAAASTGRLGASAGPGRRSRRATAAPAA